MAVSGRDARRATLGSFRTSVTWQPASWSAAKMRYREKMDLRVETYSGYKADERPVRFELKGRKLQVARLLDQWYGPDYSYFRIVADDGNTYVCCDYGVKAASKALSNGL